MERAGDFVVATQGICFLCRDTIKLDILSESVLESIVKRNQSANQSIQYISRYLKMHMSKVFVSEGAIPPHLLKKVKRSRLKVELCDECSRLNETFSKLFRKLEKVEMEISSCLDKIAKKLANAKGSPKGGDFHTLIKCEPKDVGLLEKLKIADALRKDAVQKSNRKMKIKSTGPQVRVKKLSPKDIPTKKPRLHHRKYPSFRGIEVGPSTADCDDSGHSDDMEVDHGDAMHVSYRSVGPMVERRNIVSKSDYSTNSETGKVKCNACSREFASYQAFHHHYKADHLKIRYKCKMCPSDFSHGSSLKAHQRSVHLGQRIKCKFCPKTFAKQGQLRAHMNAECHKRDGSERPDERPNEIEMSSDNISASFKVETEGDDEQSNLKTPKLVPEPVEHTEPHPSEDG